MTFWIGLVIGVLVGSFGTVAVIAICSAGKEEDK